MRDATSEKEAPVSLERKLKLAGVSYMLGDAAMMVAGHMRGKKNVVASAATWLVGGGAAAWYGNPHTEQQLHILAGRLEQHFYKNGIVIPSEIRAQSSLLKEKSFWEKTEQFLYAHPSEILNSSYALGAGMLMAKGITKDFWMGACILTGALAGLLIKEDPEARKKAENGSWFDKTIAFAKEKPLRVSGSLYAAGNIFLAGNMVEDFRKRNSTYQGKKVQPYFFSTLQLACYLFSNTMLFLSPRNQMTDSGVRPEAMARLEDAAARIIAAQPVPVQVTLVQDIAQYLAQQKGVKIPPQEIKVALQQRLTKLQPQPTAQSFAAREEMRAETPQAIKR
ncbi:MAG: hypothetical protein LW853_02155 [Rickettsiales bacterium]|nr:hypothetical protein [Rickettsiales bacterium]